MSDFAHYAREISRRLGQIEAENESLRLRLDNVLREGRVTKIDGETGKAEVDMHGLPSTSLDISHRSGAIREWNPPAVGERVIVLNPSGEPGRGVVMQGGYSDEFAQPHKVAGESYKTVGSTSILQTGDKIVLKAGASSITLEGGKITYTSDENHMVGVRLGHNTKNVGDTHVHSGVTPGAALTDVPEE